MEGRGRKEPVDKILHFYGKSIEMENSIPKRQIFGNKI
jgi:hypothetical protein